MLSGLAPEWVQVSVMAASGVVAFLMSNSPFYTDPVKYPSTFLSSPFAPILLCLFVGYVIGSIFFSVRSLPKCPATASPTCRAQVTTVARAADAH